MIPQWRPTAKVTLAPSCSVGAEVVELWERLFEDETSKDVAIIASDGEEMRVHSIVFTNLSDAFKAMLGHDMEEGRARKVPLRDFTKAQLQFFFRLAYTGQVDPADWGHAAQGFGDGGSNGKLVQGMAKGRARQKPRHGSNASSTIGSTSGSDSYEEAAQVVDLSSLKGKRKARGKGKAGKVGGRVPPLDLLFASAAISKQYGVRGFLDKMVQKIKARIDVGTFDEIAAFAIAHDLGPLRVSCVRVAEASHAVRQLYDAGRLRPEVAFELQAIWPPRSERRGKKRKAFF
mmetsp:Transcript_53548/g.148882  ORF Transcript_53548/g.148882 Transcript_53548/m.148882 type:complete len:289 (-) Transcript_53548:147-1013(-)